MLYYLLALIFLLAPWLLFVGLAMVSRTVDDSATVKYRNRGLCTSPGCIRCNRNKQEFLQGLERFNKIYKDDTRYALIRRGLEASHHGGEELFLRLGFDNAHPVWALQDLASSFRNDLRTLESAAATIVEESEKALKCAYLWRKNEAAGGSFWFTFSLINQGAWQEEQCRVCPELVRVLHQIGNLLVDCVFGNVFISMLPQNMEISEHKGMTNTRLRVHLGVEIPADREHCYMVVGGEQFGWENGRVVVFDDSYP